jgi:2-methylcitrate dehydratase
MISGRSLCRATRSACRSTTNNTAARAPLRLAQQSFKAQASFPSYQHTPIRAFSATMIPKSDASASPAPKAEFDKEIVDMASYIHNYDVKSDLAVSFLSIE